MSRLFRKLTLQHAFLQLEKEEVDETCQNSEIEMRLYVEEHYPQHYETLYNAPPVVPDKEVPQPAPEDTSNKESTQTLPEPTANKKPPNKDLKNLYRQIAERSHPDKTGNDNKAEIFSKAAKAYKEKDIATLLDLGGQVNITDIDLSEDSLELLQKNVETLELEIHTKRTSVAWIWHCTSEEEKNSLVLKLFKFKGIEHNEIQES